MLKKWMDAWGYYPLALLCAGVILFSAVWTRNQPLESPPDAQALWDDSQRLKDVTPSPAPPALFRPADGETVRPFSEQAVFFPALRLWHSHPGVDFAAQPGDPVFALKEGVAAREDGAVRIQHPDGSFSLYRGLKEILVSPGQSVRAGERIGKAGARVPFEGEGFVCVTLYRDDQPVNYESMVDKQGNKSYNKTNQSFSNVN